jgi:hypothetical protein
MRWLFWCILSSVATPLPLPTSPPPRLRPTPRPPPPPPPLPLLLPLPPQLPPWPLATLSLLHLLSCPPPPSLPLPHLPPQTTLLPVSLLQPAPLPLPSPPTPSAILPSPLPPRHPSLLLPLLPTPLPQPAVALAVSANYPIAAYAVPTAATSALAAASVTAAAPAALTASSVATAPACAHAAMGATGSSDGPTNRETSGAQLKEGHWSKEDTKKLADFCTSETWVGWEHVGRALGRSWSACASKWYRMQGERGGGTAETDGKKHSVGDGRSASRKEKRGDPWTETDNAKLCQYREEDGMDWGKSGVIWDASRARVGCTIMIYLTRGGGASDHPNLQRLQRPRHRLNCCPRARELASGERAWVKPHTPCLRLTAASSVRNSARRLRLPAAKGARTATTRVQPGARAWSSPERVAVMLRRHRLRMTRRWSSQKVQCCQGVRAGLVRSRLMNRVR